MQRRKFIASAACAAASAYLMACNHLVSGGTPAPTSPAQPARDVTHHRFGVNYTPTQNWWYCWNNWDIDSINQDLDDIASLGADHLRIFPIWPVFQTSATSVSNAYLDLLGQMLTEMEARGLDAVLPVFTGQLSGNFFLPAFNETGAAFYTDSDMFSAQTVYIQALATMMKQHDNIIGFDFGNEIDTCWNADTSAGDPWMANMFALMNSAYPGGIHVNGVGSNPWFYPETFSAQALAAAALPVMHAYPFYCGSLNYGGPMDPPSTQLLAALAALIRAYAGNAQTPVWAGEYNTCIESLTETQQAAWLETATTSAIENGVCWFTYWDSHDLNPKFTNFASLEYSLGLFTNNGVIKQQGQTYKQLIASYGGKPVVIPASTLPPPPAAPDTDSTWQWLLDFLQWKP